jgi:hypothetical protein
VLKKAASYRVDDWVFPGRRRGRPMALTTLTRALRAAGGGDSTVHGWRSAFKDWASERTTFPKEVSEMALAHTIGDSPCRHHRRALLHQLATAISSLDLRISSRHRRRPTRSSLSAHGRWDDRLGISAARATALNAHFALVSASRLSLGFRPLGLLGFLDLLGASP